MEITTREQRRAERAARRRRLLLAAGLGVGLGLVCRFLPHEYQAPCELAARIFGILSGAP